MNPLHRFTSESLQLGGWREGINSKGKILRTRSSVSQLIGHIYEIYLHAVTQR
jgi:hypothetical protein